MFLKIDAGNYSDQFLMTAQVVECILNRADMLTPNEVQVAKDLLKLMNLEVNAYTRVGLPIERAYWEGMQKKMKEIFS